jgi:hypothetical protein
MRATHLPKVLTGEKPVATRRYDYEKFSGKYYNDQCVTYAWGRTPVFMPYRPLPAHQLQKISEEEARGRKPDLVISLNMPDNKLPVISGCFGSSILSDINNKLTTHTRAPFRSMFHRSVQLSYLTSALRACQEAKALVGKAGQIAEVKALTAIFRSAWNVHPDENLNKYRILTSSDSIANFGAVGANLEPFCAVNPGIARNVEVRSANVNRLTFGPGVAIDWASLYAGAQALGRLVYPNVRERKVIRLNYMINGAELLSVPLLPGVAFNMDEVNKLESPTGWDGNVRSAATRQVHAINENISDLECKNFDILRAQEHCIVVEGSFDDDMISALSLLAPQSSTNPQSVWTQEHNVLRSSARTITNLTRGVVSAQKPMAITGVTRCDAPTEAVRRELPAAQVMHGFIHCMIMQQLNKCTVNGYFMRVLNKDYLLAAISIVENPQHPAHSESVEEMKQVVQGMFPLNAGNILASLLKISFTESVEEAAAMFIKCLKALGAPDGVFRAPNPNAMWVTAIRSREVMIKIYRMMAIAVSDVFKTTAFHIASTPFVATAIYSGVPVTNVFEALVSDHVDVWCRHYAHKYEAFLKQGDRRKTLIYRLLAQLYKALQFEVHLTSNAVQQTVASKQGEISIIRDHIRALIYDQAKTEDDLVFFLDQEMNDSMARTIRNKFPEYSNASVSVLILAAERIFPNSHISATWTKYRNSMEATIFGVRNLLQDLYTTFAGCSTTAQAENELRRIEGRMIKPTAVMQGGIQLALANPRLDLVKTKNQPLPPKPTDVGVKRFKEHVRRVKAVDVIASKKIDVRAAEEKFKKPEDVTLTDQFEHDVKHYELKDADLSERDFYRSMIDFDELTAYVPDVVVEPAKTMLQFHLREAKITVAEENEKLHKWLGENGLTLESAMSYKEFGELEKAIPQDARSYQLEVNRMLSRYCQLCEKVDRGTASRAEKDECTLLKGKLDESGRINANVDQTVIM